MPGVKGRPRSVLYDLSSSHGIFTEFSSRDVAPNARPQLLPEAGATQERTL
jgi:hypothetical protein